MLVIPCFFSKSKKQFGIFLSEGGRSLWSVDDNTTHKEFVEILNDNGFPFKSMQNIGGIIYVTVNYDELKLTDFYLWSEVDPLTTDKDVWRIFSIPDELLKSEKIKSFFYNNFYLNS